MELHTALGIACGFAGSMGSVSWFGHVAVNDGFIYAGDGSVFVKLEVPDSKGIQTLIPAKFLKRLLSPAIKISVKGNNLHIKSGRTRASIPATDFTLFTPLRQLDQTGIKLPLPGDLWNLKGFAKEIQHGSSGIWFGYVQAYSGFCVGGTTVTAAIKIWDGVLPEEYPLDFIPILPKVLDVWGHFDTIEYNGDSHTMILRGEGITLVYQLPVIEGVIVNFKRMIESYVDKGMLDLDTYIKLSGTKVLLSNLQMQHKAVDAIISEDYNLCIKAKDDLVIFKVSADIPLESKVVESCSGLEGTFETWVTGKDFLKSFALGFTHFRRIDNTLLLATENVSEIRLVTTFENEPF